MPKAAPPRTRGRKSAAEVQKEFSAVRAAVEEEAQVADPKTAEAARLQEAEIREAAGGLTVESVTQKVSGLSVEISRALGGVGERLVEQVQLLSTVREAVELERRELERLHKIDVAATALDQMVRQYEQQKADLEAEIASRRAAFEEEMRAAERERKEQEDSLRKQRQREMDDYEYKKALERKKAQDKYEEDQRLLEKKNQEKQETLEKSWREREAKLKEREQELAALRAQVEEFPERLEREVAEAAQRAAKETEAKLNQQIVLLKKDADAERRLGELRVKTLEETVAAQSQQLAAVQAQLEEAKKQVQEIAVKAIEGASGARALSHVNQIAMEQARQRQPQG